ncbi:hypothetical protein C922_00172 [Plasmodium inui San Antonio 1]|uniref:Uncharacterized protein n=1 Tax=Plasmodium inui San Antonio 1 TaxID=1237626 RepID=W7AKE6_9APIC|nr:hypothetical protein C922_00172 [Plasmodium inui San Antonio 1]EUD69309.1 hypothetical protein C922_00172 [Plasmodium inui San Antonio 1]
MKDQLKNKSEEYQKLLLSASIRREAKQNEENKKAKKQQCGNNDNNDFIIYMEFKFENLILSRYLFEIRDELGTPIRNSVQITRFIIMRSENHIMGTCVSDRIILCYRNDKETTTILRTLKEELRKNYSICLTDEGNKDTNGNEIDKALLSYIIQFTLVCKYVECGKWVHIWDNMDTIIESKFCGNNSSKYFNCIGFKFHILNTNYRVASPKRDCIHFVQMHLKVMLSMYKVLPLVEEQMCENMFVYCLPRCSMRATILDVLDTSDAKVEEQNFNYQDYWLNVHGYVLNQNALKKIVKVRLYKGVFNYPQGVLLRDNIYKLNIAVKNDPFFYVCNFLSTFELLKRAEIKLLRFSECDEGGKNLYDDLLPPQNSKRIRKEQSDNQDDSEFYAKLNRICKHQFEGNNFSPYLSQSNKLQRTYDNSYQLYGNTLTTTSGVSINLDFSKNKKSGSGERDSSRRDLDAFLKKSAQDYYAREVDLQQGIIHHQRRHGPIQHETQHHAVPYEARHPPVPYEPLPKPDYRARNANPRRTDDLIHKTTQQGTTVVPTTDHSNCHAETKRAQLGQAYTVGNQNQGNQLDKYLHNVAKSYTSVEGKNNPDHMAEANIFESVNPQIIFSKEFENFLDNLDEAALYQEQPLLPPVNFDQREGKRPNFPITTPPFGQMGNRTQVKKTHKMT